MSTIMSRPILKNLFTFAYICYNIELGVANYTGVASHGWLTIRWLKFARALIISKYFHDRRRAV